MDCGVSVARPWITSSRGQQCGDQGSEELNTEADRVSQSRRYTCDPQVLGWVLWKHTHWASATPSMRPSKS
jgi:hypothetical protein